MAFNSPQAVLAVIDETSSTSRVSAKLIDSLNLRRKPRPLAPGLSVLHGGKHYCELQVCSSKVYGYAERIISLLVDPSLDSEKLGNGRVIYFSKNSFLGELTSEARDKGDGLSSEDSFDRKSGYREAFSSSWNPFSQGKQMSYSPTGGSFR
jgi:hypothetical protein